MKKLDDEEIRHLGLLSMVPISETDIGRVREELNAILDFFSAVSEFTGERSSDAGLRSGGREDVVSSDGKHCEGIVADFPRSSGRTLVVPRGE